MTPEQRAGITREFRGITGIPELFFMDSAATELAIGEIACFSFDGAPLEIAKFPYSLLFLSLYEDRGVVWEASDRNSEGYTPIAHEDVPEAIRIHYAVLRNALLVLL